MHRMKTDRQKGNLTFDKLKVRRPCATDWRKKPRWQNWGGGEKSARADGTGRDTYCRKKGGLGDYEPSTKDTTKEKGQLTETIV